MKICHRCGCRDHEQWRHSRFDYNADYMRFDEAKKIGLKAPENFWLITRKLKSKRNFEPFILGPYTYYRRGTGGIWLYRAASEDFKIPRERKNHSISNQHRLLEVTEK